MKVKSIVFSLGLCLCSLANGQTLLMEDFEPETVRIAKEQLTLIAAKHDRIEQVSGQPGTYELQTDNKAGTVLLKPLTQKPVQVFLTTEQRHHYVLLLLPVMGRAAPLVILPKPSSTTKPKPKVILAKSQKVKRLLRTMVTHSNAYQVKIPAAQKEYLSERLYRTVIKQYLRDGLTGTVYQLSNTSAYTQSLEPERLSHRNTLTVNFFQKYLPPEQSLIYFEVQQ